ncbi:Zinc transporter zitB [Serratia fonticola]|uniref:Zinc transporter zitB n=1 Tax=Serratia fonticola TaxID=47917 RepID=A0A4U9UK71_SERFO|nr:Zinc transporter zitB [Serratia fonticola]
MVVEAIGGLLSGSLALLADAGHMLTDSAALLVALMAVHFSQRKPNARHTFGYLRLTTLAAFINAAALLLIVVFILWGGHTAFLRTTASDGYPNAGDRRSGSAG